MEVENLLNQLHEEAVDDDQDDEQLFLTTNFNKESFTDSTTFKRALFCVIAFIIAIFIGFLIESESITNLISSNQEMDITYFHTTTSPTASSQQLVHNNLPRTTSSITITTTTTDTSTKVPTTTSSTSTKAPTTSTTSTNSVKISPTTTKPTSPTTARPTTARTIIGDKTDNDVLFVSYPLPTSLQDAELAKLEITIDIITVNENEGLKIQRNDGSFHGAFGFNYKYPKNEEDEYKTNEIRRMCYNFQFESTSIINNAIIQIKFNKFELESGFDRVLIRHFNESFIDLPLSYTGYQRNISIQYLMEKGTTKTICIEFQSDDTITDNGIDYDVNIYYDLCQWTDWDQCYAMNLWGKRWSRGPFMNGKCGLGVTSKYRLNRTDKIDGTDIDYDGFLQDCNDKEILNKHGPEYCLKRKCEDWDNYNDPEFDPTKVPGQGRYNLYRYYNGAGRLDPYYPDPFRIYLSTENNLFNDINDDDEWLDNLENKLIEKAAEISDDHQDVRILEFAVIDPDHRNETAEYLGAKVMDSLINGKPFIVGISGDSVSSGHDNMFMSTYPMQLQSRLRKWWTEIGNKGSTFFTRNFAVGGGLSSDSQGFMPIPMVTETFPDRFCKLNTIISDVDNYDIWYRNGGYPIRKIDVELFEYSFTEGAGTHSSKELHLREAAYLGAIWGNILPISGLEHVDQGCKSWDDLEQEMPRDWHQWKRSPKWWDKWAIMKDEYFNKMGIVGMEPNYGMAASCPVYKDGTTIIREGRSADDGEIPDGEMYAYTNYWLKVNWHPNSRGQRIMSDIISYWIINSSLMFLKKYKNEMGEFKDIDSLSKFLKEKSGNWADEILQSVIHKKYDEFVVPGYCGNPWLIRNKTGKSNKIFWIQSNDYCESIPFALTNVRPTIYNTHNLLNEYIYYGLNKNKNKNDDFKKYVQSVGWKWFSSNSIISIDRKEGTEGNMDTFWKLQPDAKYIMNQFKEWKKNENIDDELNGFHKYLISNKIYLQFVVKTPKYGSGRIKIFNGYNCNEYMQRSQSVAVYVDKLENINNNNNNNNNNGNDLGEMIKNEECIINGLELDTKYVVSYVPYNITAKGSGEGQGFEGFLLMFLVAY